MRRVYTFRGNKYYFENGNWFTALGDLVLDQTVYKWLTQLAQSCCGTNLYDDDNKSNINVTITNHISNFHEDVAADGPDLNYVHTQKDAQFVWVINHNLNKYPSVDTFSANDVEVVGVVEYTDTNTLTVRFSKPVSGKAYLN